jgi:hypothetical protein
MFGRSARKVYCKLGKLEHPNVFRLVLGQRGFERRLQKPSGIRVQQQKQDHAQRQDVRVNQHHHRAVIKTPALLQAANGVPGAQRSNQCRDEQLKRCTIIWEAGQAEGEQQTTQNQRGSSRQRTMAKVQSAESHGEESYTVALTVSKVANRAAHHPMQSKSEACCFIARSVTAFSRRIQSGRSRRGFQAKPRFADLPTTK